jgi:peroxiredoxin
MVILNKINTLMSKIKVASCMFVSLSFALSGMAQGTYQLSGKIDGLSNEKIYLSNDGDKTDSTIAQSGTFSFTGKISQAQYFSLRIAGKEYRGTGFFMAPGRTAFKGNADSLSKAVITGNPYNKQWREWLINWAQITAQARPMYMRLDSVSKGGKVKESAEERKIFEDGMKSLQAQTDVAVTAFVTKYPQSPVSPFIIMDRFINYPNPEMEAKTWAILSKEGKGTFYGKKITEHQKIALKTAIGATPDFSVADTSGKMVKLSSLRGKYILVDFWASWCGPCRKENPNVVKAYQQYHDKGFDIMSVSLDTNKDAWMKAVTKDNLTWNHVSDLKGWKSPVVAEYGIRAVPTSFLLDKDGKIIAKDLRGEKLEEKLKELMQ